MALSEYVSRGAWRDPRFFLHSLGGFARQLLLAFSGSCGMIGGFMSSENPKPTETKGAQRQADVYDLLAWLEVNKMKVATVAVVLVVIGFAIATIRYVREQKELR